MEEIQRRIMAMLLAGDLPVLGPLRAQYEHAAITYDGFSGSGFDAYFAIPDELPRADPANLELHDVEFQLEGAEHPGAVLLFVRAGCLDMLEVFNWADDWPENPKLARLNYMEPVRPWSDPFSVSVQAAERRDEEWIQAELAARLRPHSA